MFSENGPAYHWFVLSNDLLVAIWSEVTDLLAALYYLNRLNFAQPNFNAAEAETSKHETPTWRNNGPRPSSGDHALRIICAHLGNTRKSYRWRRCCKRNWRCLAKSCCSRYCVAILRLLREVYCLQKFIAIKQCTSLGAHRCPAPTANRSGFTYLRNVHLWNRKNTITCFEGFFYIQIPDYQDSIELQINLLPAAAYEEVESVRSHLLHCVQACSHCHSASPCFAGYQQRPRRYLAMGWYQVAVP